MDKDRGDEKLKIPPNDSSNGNPPLQNTARVLNEDRNTISTHTIHHEPINIIVENNQPQDINAVTANRISILSNKIAKRANWISIGNFILAIAIFIVTYFLFRETQKSTNAATKAANAAENTYREQKFNDSITRRIDSINSIVNDINERKRFELDSINREMQNKSVATQINSLQEVQKEFVIANRPFITITNINIDTSFTNNVITCSLNFENKGNFPGKVLSISSLIAFGTDTASKKLLKTHVSTQSVNQYLAGEIELPWKMNIYFQKAAADRIKYFVKKGDINVYFIGDYLYYDPTFKKYYKNKFVIQINYREFIKISYLVNDEYEYKYH